ncbi:Glutamate racemase [Pediococcus pentosaceus]|uniref:Glutamate racemase n=1 Tax=Pediococcus pentosaceus TaxID=1255 RepID=A0A1Y0VRY6_PEDPE|nr:Glutamate racemase [Pediococcus pentosaceus]
MDNRPIGFMDSGVGGLTVVKTAQKLLPNEEVIFIGDEARMPYGPRPTAEVVEFSRQMASFLMTKNIKALVIACNTATNAALAVLQAELPIPVIGVILPGAIAANRQTKNQKLELLLH